MGFTFVKWYWFRNCSHFYLWIQKDPLDRLLSSQLGCFPCRAPHWMWPGIATAPCPMSSPFWAGQACIWDLYPQDIWSYPSPSFILTWLISNLLLSFRSLSEKSCFMEAGGHWCWPVCTCFKSRACQACQPLGMNNGVPFLPAVEVPKCSPIFIKKTWVSESPNYRSVLLSFISNNC